MSSNCHSQVTTCSIIRVHTSTIRKETKAVVIANERSTTLSNAAKSIILFFTTDLVTYNSISIHRSYKRLQLTCLSASTSEDFQSKKFDGSKNVISPNFTVNNLADSTIIMGKIIVVIAYGYNCRGILLLESD